MKEKMADDMEAEDDLFEDKSGAYFGQDLQRLESTHSKVNFSTLRCSHVALVP